MAERSAAAKLNDTELAAFFGDMGMMIQSGITVTEAVSLLKEDYAGEEGALSKALESMSEDLMAYGNLSDSMKKSGAFPDYAAELTSASEYTGRLEETMFHLSSYYETESRMKSTFASSVRYPLILLFMVMAVLAALLIMVFPSFYGVYSKLAGSLSDSSFSFINISFILCRVMMVFLVVLAAVILTGVWSWKKGKREKVLNFMSQFSAFKEMLDSIYLYRFSSSFGMYLSAGENQDSALERSLKTAEGAVREKLEKCRELMASGKSFSQAAFEERLYDRASSRTLLSAERTGMLDSAMTGVTESLRDTAEERASRIADTAEPVMTGSLMIFIGLILVSIMLPLIGIMNSIG